MWSEFAKCSQPREGMSSLSLEIFEQGLSDGLPVPSVKEVSPDIEGSYQN